MIRLPGLAILATAFAAGVAAGEPMSAESSSTEPAAFTEPSSAIPWLSESLREPRAPARPRARPGEPTGGGAGAIRTTPLGGIALDAVGLLLPERTGFARDLWGPTTAEEARELILDHADRGVPETRALFRRLLLAEADPPPDAGTSADLLVARIDRLMALGALEEAEALIERAGPENPALFRRYFDIGLLLDRAEPACAALRQNASLSPTLPARIFCLARDGDWNAAEIILTLGAEMGELSPDEEAALARFLDPEIFEGVPPPEPPMPLTPLDFLLREAVGLPRPAEALPPAFLHKDLPDWMPMRGRIEAAETLALNGAVPHEVLFAAYRAGEPAASGGLWDRAAAVQALDDALATADPEAVSAALAEADGALDARGLRTTLAHVYAEPLAALDPDELDPPARAARFQLLLLAERPEAADAGEADGMALVKIAGMAPTEADPGTVTAADPLLAAAQTGLAERLPPDDRAQQLAILIAHGRQGEALIKALALLAEGPRVDPPSLRTALFVLKLAGLEDAARRIAVQTILSGDVDP